MQSHLLRTWLSMSLLALPLAAQTAGDDPAYQPRPPQLLLRYAEFDPIESNPTVPAPLAMQDTSALWIVQFRDLPTDADRDLVRGLGGRLLGYVPEQAYVVRMSSGAANALSSLAPVRWVGPYHPAYRLEPALLTQLLAGVDLPVQRYNVVVADKRNDKPALAAAIRTLGGTVIEEHPGGLLMEVGLDGAQLRQAASLDQVLWIDRRTPIELDMVNARIQGGANYVESLGGYSGAGIRGHVYEGVQSTHYDFDTAPVPVGSGNTASSHGHCTAGIVFGNGSSHPDARGMAPDAVFFFTNYGGTPYSSVTRWNTIDTLIDSHQVMFTTASWGHARTIFYTSISADADDNVFDHDIPWTQSQSNAGATSQPRDSRPEAWAKNVTAVGGVYHFDDSNPANDRWNGSPFSRASIGFARDGRIKPDLCAYYDRIHTSDLLGGSGYSALDHYDDFGGTSGATPIVAGHNALAIQMFTDGVFGNPLRVPGGSRFENRPHFTTLRALLIATANQYPFTSTSTDNKREHQGWGFPSLRNMYDNRARLFIVDETDLLAQGQSNSYVVRVLPGTPELKVTLSYCDPPGNPAVSIARVNDLDLLVTSPSSTAYRGNYGLKTANYSTPGGVYDDRDTTECVFVRNPAPGNWRVSVIARAVVMDSHVETPSVDADYGLVVNGGVEGSRCAFYAPDDDPTTGVCNVYPFGNGSTAQGNIKTQFVLRRDDLGGSGLITGLAFAPCDSGTRRHDTIQVRMSHVAAGWTLSSAFDNNMPAPRTVLFQRGYYWRNLRDRWNEVGLQNPFAYDGVSDVVVEITTWGNDFLANGGFAGMHRSSTRQRVYAYGWTRPPATGTTDDRALKMRVDFGCGRASVLGAGCGPTQLSQAPLPAYVRTYSANQTRGFYFQAPIDFSIRGLRVPDETGHGRQNVEVFRMAAEPPAFPATGTGTQVFYVTGVPSGVVIPTDIPFAAGEWVGILGAAGDATVMHNSYGTPEPPSHVLGFPVVLRRFLTQTNIVASGGNQPYSGEPSFEIARVETYFDAQLSIGHGPEPQLGTSTAITLFGGRPRNPVSFTFGVDNSLPLYPFDLRVVGAGGCKVWHDIATMVNLFTDVKGNVAIPYTVPPVPAVAGSKVYSQAVQLNPSAPGGLVTSDYVRIVWGL